MVTERDRAEADDERRAHLWFLEGMDKVNRAIQGAGDLEALMSDVLDVALVIFGCDRAWLLHPCDPDAATWSVPMERTVPSHPGAHASGFVWPMSPDASRVFRTALAATGPVHFGPGSEHALASESIEPYGVQSQLCMAIRPRLAEPYLFGLHQCTHPRLWTPQEVRLFQEIGRRLADALTSVLAHRGLRDSEMRHREIFEKALDAMVVYEVTDDGRFRFLDVNPAWIRMLGFDRSVIGRCFDELVDPATSRVLAQYRRCVAAAAPMDYDETIELSTGRWSLHTSLIPVVDAAGRVYRLIGIGRDVTKQKQAEAALRGSEARLAEAERVAHVGYWHRDLSVDRIYWSHETHRIFGMPPQADGVAVEEFLARIHPEDRSIVRGALGAALRGESRYDVEYRVQRPDGSIRFVHSQGDLSRDEAGVPRTMFGTVQDITERKHAERALLESHGLLNAVIEGTSDAIFVKDREGRYVMINAAGAAFWGKRPEEIVGRDDLELSPRDVALAVMARDREVMASGIPQSFEETVQVGDAVRTYLTTKRVHRDAQGAVIGLIGIAIDVTERIRMEERIREAQKMEAVGRLAGGVAHDFNNLLTIINSYSEMVMDDLPETHPDRELLAAIHQAGERASHLTRQLLAFSRKQILQPEIVSIDTVLEALRPLLRPLLGEDVELTIATEPDLGMARIDRAQFEQAIVNLAANARDAMPGGGRLAIHARNVHLGASDTERAAELSAGPYVLIEVSDSGKGIDDDTMARIFEPFFTTKGPGEGTGLGLAMVYGFVKQSGGHIGVESGADHGTTFQVYLPRTDAAPAPSRSPAAPRDVARGSETVLLVEDEAAVRSLALRVLRSCGYTVLEASSGLDALDLLAHEPHRIDLLVTDLVMPRMSGRQLADRLLAERPDLRVVFMSGYTDEEILRRGVSDGAISFLPKPFRAADLARVAREALDAKRGSAS